MDQNYKEFSRYKNELCLSSETDLLNYINLLGNMEHITVIFSVKDIQGYSLTAEIAAEMKALGFEKADILLEKCYHSFVGIITDGKRAVEKIGVNEEPSEYTGDVAGKQIRVVSRTLPGGDLSEIYVDGIDYSLNMRGFNIVVIDNITGKVIDKVNFDTHVDELTCLR